MEPQRTANRMKTSEFIKQFLKKRKRIESEIEEEIDHFQKDEEEVEDKIQDLFTYTHLIVSDLYVLLL